MRDSIKQLSMALAVLCVFGMLGACGNVSRGVAKDGRTAEALVWPAPNDTTPIHNGGTFPNRDDLHLVKAGLNKQQIANLIGFPHFSEGVWGVREWNYLFNFREPGSDTVTTCQFKVLFDQDKLASSFYWMPAQCAHYQQPAALADAAGQPSEQFNLSTDALFAFDRASVADITHGGKDQLGQLAHNLQVHKSRIGNIRIMGYTDRLGGDAYNDSLSERRAYAIMDYLVAHGVPSDLIQAEGLGKADPVKDCPDSERATLIDCLAPNRRIVVLVNLLDTGRDLGRSVKQ